MTDAILAAICPDDRPCRHCGETISLRFGVRWTHPRVGTCGDKYDNDWCRPTADERKLRLMFRHVPDGKGGEMLAEAAP